jgi:hypothetical protein
MQSTELLLRVIAAIAIRCTPLLVGLAVTSSPEASASSGVSRDIAATSIQAARDCPSRSLSAIWRSRTEPAPTAGTRGARIREVVLEVVVDGDVFYAAARPVGGAPGESVVEMFWGEKGGPVLTRTQPIGGGASTIIVSHDRRAGGAVEDATVLAQLGTGLPFGSDGTLATAFAEAVEWTQEAASTWRVRVAARGRGDSSWRLELLVDVRSCPVVMEMVNRSASSSPPSDGEVLALGGELEVLEVVTGDHGTVARSAERRSYAWFPGAPSPEAQRTTYRLEQVGRLAASPKELADLQRWLEPGTTIVDAVSGATGTIGEDFIVLNGMKHALQRRLSAEDVASGRALTDLCVASGVDERQAGSVSNGPSDDDGGSGVGANAGERGETTVPAWGWLLVGAAVGGLLWATVKLRR